MSVIGIIFWDLNVQIVNDVAFLKVHDVEVKD